MDREIVQKKSKEIGRCVCSTKVFPFECECKFFKDFNICHCAGEKHEGYDHQQWTKYNLDV